MYSRFLTYEQIRNRVKEQSQDEHFRKNVIIFGLTWVTGDDGTFLVACTGEGELVVWNIPGIEGSTLPIFRYETLVLLPFLPVLPFSTPPSVFYACSTQPLQESEDTNLLFEISTDAKYARENCTVSN